MRRTAALLLASATAFALSHPAAAAPQNKWNAWADGGVFVNNRDDGRGEITLWAPLDQTADSVTFLDLRGKLFDAGELEGNLAFGYREQHDGWNFGVWAGFDLRGSALDSTFPQISGGVEALSPDWDFRLNGYAPLDDENVISAITTAGPATPTILLNGNSILLQTGTSTTTAIQTELAFGGADAEIGTRVLLELLGIDAKKLDLRLYGGGFYFDNDKAPHSISGPRVRLELRINDIIDTLPGSRLTLEAEYTNDDVRDDRSEVGLRLRIPLGGDGPSLASMTLLDQRMSDGLRRDTDVVASTKATSTSTSTIATEAVKDYATQVVLSKVAYVDGATAGGVSTVAAAQGANTLIIADGSNGILNGVTVLQQDQTLAGGGSYLALEGVTTGTTVLHVVPGTLPTLHGPTTQIAMIARTNTHITGINLDASAAQIGIWILPSGSSTQVGNVVIDGNNITTNMFADAISTRDPGTTSSDNIVIVNNQINNANVGIYAAEMNNGLILHNKINAQQGIRIGGFTSPTFANVQIDHNTIVTPQSALNNIGIWLASGTGSGIDITANAVVAYYPFVVSIDNTSGTFTANTLDAAAAGYDVYLPGTQNVFTGTANTSPDPLASYCLDTGGNPNTNIAFVGGGLTCP